MFCLRGYLIKPHFSHLICTYNYLSVTRTKVIDQINIASCIQFEDNHIIVINKPPGIAVQGNQSGESNLLDLTKKYLKVKHNKPGDVYLGLVHRIDQKCSGVIVFAKTSKAASRLSDSFRTHNLVKKYVAMVEGEFKGSGELHHLLDVDAPATQSIYNVKKESESNSSSKEAKLRYAVLGTLSSGQLKSTLVDIELITGRKHQIRAQLSHIGHPIINDTKYGYNNSNSSNSSSISAIYLHSYLLSFAHPVTKQWVCFTHTNIPSSWVNDSHYSQRVVDAISNKIASLATEEQTKIALKNASNNNINNSIQHIEENNDSVDKLK